jgi:anti-sigma factor RsiW
MGEGHITCGEFAARLSDYLENEVAGTKRAQMESHAQTCAACANSLEGVRNLTRRLARMSRERPSAGFDFALRSRLMMEAAQKPSFWNRLPDVFFPTIPRALASAAAVVLMALGMTTALDEAPETRGANADRVHQMTLVAPSFAPFPAEDRRGALKMLPQKTSLPISQQVHRAGRADSVKGASMVRKRPGRHLVNVRRVSF